MRAISFSPKNRKDNRRRPHHPPVLEVEDEDIDQVETDEASVAHEINRGPNFLGLAAAFDALPA